MGIEIKTWGTTKVALLKIDIEDGSGNVYAECKVKGYGENEKAAREDLEMSITELLNELKEYLFF